MSTAQGAELVTLFLFSESELTGGVARVMLNVADGLAARGHAVELVLTGRFDREAVPVDGRVNVVSLGVPGLRRSFWPLVNYLKVVRPFVMLSAMEHPNIIAVWARQMARVDTRLVLSSHGSLPERLSRMYGWRERLMLPPLLRLSYGKADSVVAVSEGVAKGLADIARIRNVRRIYNPITVKPNRADSEQRDEQSVPAIMSAGRFVLQKDFGTFLRAFALARRKRPMRLIILGDGTKRGELESLAQNLGIAGDTSFPGWVDDPAPHMRAASVFVLSSLWEGFGNVIVEAMACGTPVVSTDCPSGPSEILENGKYGRLVPVGDHRAMAQAILDTLDAPPDPEFLKARAMEFGVEKIVEEYIDVLGLRATAEVRT